MIELSKSTRVAYESLDYKEKKYFTKLYESMKKNPDLILKTGHAKKLPNIENTYILKLSNQFRAIVKICGEKVEILEIVNRNNLKKIFGSI